VTVFAWSLANSCVCVVTETIFSWPGIGKLDHRLDTSLDRPVMVAYLILVALLFVLINLIVDLVYALLTHACRRGAHMKHAVRRFLERVSREPDRGSRRSSS